MYSKLINNDDFLKYYLQNNLKNGINRNGLNGIRFNKKSISVTIQNHHYFNDFFNEKNLLNEILKILQIYIIEHNLNLPHDMDFLRHKFKKININYKRW